MRKFLIAEFFLPAINATVFKPLENKKSPKIFLAAPKMAVKRHHVRPFLFRDGFNSYVLI